ncbi:MAG TPA: glycerol-3-phosphate dehydrogenase [Gemmataceae bacterium]|nr:glycerol-3-phosphate dehydrogenase [Gemmataceae bacterium]
MKRDVDSLRDQRFDLLILGGGITGAGVALDATLRGFRTALIDKGDFASGTSSVSSKLVHGGLRYLEHGGFHLVYEALHERRLLLKNAFPYVRPLRFAIPFYRRSRMPAWKARAALVLYDLLAGSSNLRRSRPLSTEMLRQEFPGIQDGQLLGGAEYYDAQMDDARLCLSVVRTAALQGARVANYVQAVAFEKREGKIVSVRARDQVTGAEFDIRARQVLNATGPWTDEIARSAGDAAEPLLQPTKGVHLIVSRKDLDGALLLLHPADGRVFFVIPWMEKMLIGTTDTVTDESPDSLSVTPAEIDYLLEGYNRYFQTALQSSDVLGTFAGLRPLMRSGSGKPSSLSREYRIVESSSGLISVAGGKYTTYRRMAEVITDTISRRLGRRGPCRTGTFPIDGALPVARASGVRYDPGSSGIIREIKALRGSSKSLDEESARHLVTRYGSRARDVAAYCLSDPKGLTRIVPDAPDLRGELAYQRDHEMAIYPKDVALRRTRLGLFHPEIIGTVI